MSVYGTFASKSLGGAGGPASPHHQIAAMAAGEALLALDHIKAIANALSFPQG